MFNGGNDVLGYTSIVPFSGVVLLNEGGSMALAFVF